MPTIQAILMSLTDTSNDICMKSASTAFSSQYFESVNLYLVSYGPRFHCSKITGTVGETGVNMEQYLRRGEAHGIAA